MIKKIQDINLYAPISKVDKLKRMVYGYCSSESEDSQGEIVQRDAIKRAWEAYMKFANVREMHQPSAVGITKEYSHDENGTFIGVKVVDDNAWNKVQEGVYKGFSIGGRVVSKTDNVITNIILAEISLVDRPANPDAVFTAIKVDGGLVNQLQEEAINFNKKDMSKFIEIEGVKYVEDEANAGQPLLDTEGNKVLFIEEAPKVETPVVEAPVVVEEAKAEEKVEEKPAEVVVEAPVEAKPAEVVAEPVKVEEKADTKIDLKKDSSGVITLASVLDHMNYVAEVFETRNKTEAFAQLQTVIEAVKALIATEAGEADGIGSHEEENEGDGMEMADKGGDLNKLSDALLKKVDEKFSKFDGFVKEFTGKMEAVTKDIELIKGTKVSPRPKTAIAVEKSFTSAEAGAVELGKKQAELETIRQEINKFAEESKSILANNPQRIGEVTKKSEELFRSFQDKKREVNDVLAGR
jgi:phage head maturation protease